MRQVAPSDCSSLGVPKHVDRGSAVDHHQSVFTLNATILAQVYVIDLVFNCEHVLFSRLGIDVLYIDLVHHLVVIGS